MKREEQRELENDGGEERQTMCVSCKGGVFESYEVGDPGPHKKGVFRYAKLESRGRLEISLCRKRHSHRDRWDKFCHGGERGVEVVRERRMRRNKTS